MPKRSSKKQESDLNENAARVVGRIIAASEEEDCTAPPEKDPAAVSLGRRGGLKGGKARKDSLSPERRREIAQQAAAARWKKNGDR